jgi:hypothetical protein
MSRVNPYTALRDGVDKVLRKWRFRREHTLFSWAKPTRGAEESLPYAELVNVVRGAEACGMRCTIEATEHGGLKVLARERIDIFEMPHIYEKGEIK